MNKLSEGNQHPDGMHPADAGNMFDGTGQWMLGGEPQGFHALGQQILSLPSRIASAFQLSAAERADVSGRSDTLSKFGQRFYLRQAIGGAALAGMTAPMAAPVFADTLEHDQHIDVATLAGNLTTASIALSDAAAEISTAATTQEIEAIRVKAMPHLNALNAYPSTKMIAKMAQDALNAFATEAPRTFKGAEKIKLRAKSTAVDALVVAATMSGNLAKTLGSNIGSATESQAQEIATGKEATPPQKTDNPAKTVAQKAITARAEVKVWQELDTALFDHASALLNSKTPAELETALRALEETTKTLKTYEQATQIAKTIQKKIKLIKSLIAHKKGYEKSVTALAVQLMDAGKITNTLTAEKEQSATKSLQELGSLIAKQLATQEHASADVVYIHKYTLEKLQAHGLIDANTYAFGAEMRDGTWDTKPDRWIVPPENQKFGSGYVITDVKEGRAIIVNAAGRQKIFDAIQSGKAVGLNQSEWYVLSDSSGATWVHLRDAVNLLAVSVPNIAASPYAIAAKVGQRGLGWALDKAGVKIPNPLLWLAQQFQKSPEEVTAEDVLKLLREAKNEGEKWAKATEHLSPTFANAYREAGTPAEEQALVKLYLALAKQTPKVDENTTDADQEVATAKIRERQLAIAGALNELAAATKDKSGDKLLLAAQYEALSQGVTSMQVIGEQGGKSIIAILGTIQEGDRFIGVSRIVLAEGKVNKTGVGNAQWYGASVDNKVIGPDGVSYIVVGANLTSKGSGGVSESETEITRSGKARYFELHIAAGTEVYKNDWFKIIGELGTGIGYAAAEGKDGKIIIPRGFKISFESGKEINEALKHLGISNVGIDLSVFQALDSSSLSKGNLIQARARVAEVIQVGVTPLHGMTLSPDVNWSREGIAAGIGWTHAIANEIAKLQHVNWGKPNAQDIKTITAVAEKLAAFTKMDDSTELGRQLRGHGIRAWTQQDIQQFVADTIVWETLLTESSTNTDQAVLATAQKKMLASLQKLENRNAQQRVRMVGYAHTFDRNNLKDRAIGGGYTFDYAYRAKEIAGELDNYGKQIVRLAPIDKIAPAVNDTNPGNGNDGLTANSGADQQITFKITEAGAATLTIDVTKLAIKNATTDALTGLKVSSVVSQTKVGNVITVVVNAKTTGVNAGQNLSIVDTGGGINDGRNNMTANTVVGQANTLVP